MASEKEISSVIGTLKRRRHEFVMPALTEIAEQTKNPFHVLISCILSLRTKDATTAKASERLFALADNPYDMAKLSTKAIEKAIFPVGFYRTKAKRIKVICKKLIDDHHGKVPDDFDLLMKFHGVGRKTANIVMVYGFNKLGIPVDTHVHRVSNRIGWVRTKTPEKTEFALRELLPERYWMDINDLLVQFGQNICRPVRPQCNACPVSKYCLYYKDVYLSSCNSGKAR